MSAVYFKYVIGLPTYVQCINMYQSPYYQPFYLKSVFFSEKSDTNCFWL